MYGSLLRKAKDLVENEKSREGVLNRPVPIKEEMPPEDDYIPTVSVCDYCTLYNFVYTVLCVL